MSRVALRPLEAADWRSVHAFARLPETCRHQPWGPNTEAESEAFAAAAAEAWSDDPQSRFAHAACVDGELVGVGELKVRDRAHRQGEISYVVHPRLWGQGLATAIGRKLLALGFEQRGLHRIAATCDSRNGASAAVLRRLGLTYEGTLRQTLLLRDGWRDSEVFSVLAHEWQPAESRP